MDIKQRLERLEKMTLLERVGSKPPSGQKDYMSYKGTLSQYIRESKLREVAAGKDKTFANFAKILTGSDVVGKVIGDYFGKKYSDQEIEEAKQALKEEFGIDESKEKEQKEEPSAVNEKLFEKYFKPITDSVNGIMKVVGQTSQEIKRIHSSLNTLSNSLVPVINELAGVVAGRGESAKFTADKLKPMTVTGAEGQEYLYYPDAPEGRQLYEKSKTGTAGRIASKKVQRKLKKEIDRIRNENKLTPVKKIEGESSLSDAIIQEMKNLFSEQTALRKSELEQLVKDLKSIEPNNGSSAFTEEDDEKKKRLKDALKKALEEIFQENPELLKQSDNSGIGTGEILTALGLSRLGRLKKLGGKFLKRFGLRIGGTAAASAAEAAAIEGAATAGAAEAAGGGILGTVGALVTAPVVLASAATGGIFGAVDVGMRGAGEDAIQQIAKGSASDMAIALERGFNKEYTRQRLHELATDDPALQLKLNQAEQMAGLIKPDTRTKPTGTLVVDNTTTPPVGQQIIDENRRKLEITKADNVTIPSQTVNNYNSSTVIPVPTNSNEITTTNPENTFNRLLAQDFNHPATQNALTMG